MAGFSHIACVLYWFHSISYERDLKMQLEGHRLNEYRLLYRLGNGGMGEVYYAQDERLSKKVAIRLIRSSGGTDGAGDEKTSRFQSIASTITQLDHPLIVPLLDYGETRIKGTAYLFLVM